MTTYSFLFSPSGLKVIPASNGLNNIVYSIAYRVAAIDEKNQAYKKITTTLAPPDSSSFVDYEQITESDLVDWIIISEPLLASVKADLDQELQDMASTPQLTTMPLPWEVRS